MKRPQTIRWRIAASAAGFTLVALSLLVGYFYYRFLRNIDRQTERFIDEETREAEREIKVADGELVKELRASEEAHDQAKLWFCLRDEADRILYLSPGLTDGDLPIPAPVRESLKSNARVWTSQQIFSDRARVRTTKFVLPDGRVRFLQVAALSAREPVETRASFIGQLAIAVVPCVLIALLGGFIVARRATAPIDDIAAAAARIRATGLGERIRLRGTGDEFDQLAEVLNSTFAALEESFRRIRDFSASASHQLKTPLTIIRGEADLLMRERPDDPDLARFATISEEAAHLARIVEQLLFLARADAERVDVALESVDLKAIVERGLRRIEPYVEVKKLRVELSLEGAPAAMGSDSLLGTAVQNLLDNAAKYSPEGGKLRVGLEVLNGSVALDVENEGATIPPAERERIMERFSSAGDRPGQGAGLGLAVAREIASIHHGRLAALDPREGRGVRFRLEVPRA